MVCEACFLVQVKEFENPEDIFKDYAYFSSYSESWLTYSQAFANRITDLFGLDAASQVVELASNDGYLLQYFKQRGIPVLGIEPAENVASVAVAKGIPTLAQFFGSSVARELVEKGCQADLLIANNVLAHVPNLNDFVAGMKIALKPSGTATVEFPHLMQLIKQNEFDTIYHEHFSYFSLFTAEKVFSKHGLSVFDVEELPTHGGSLRLFVSPMEKNVKVQRSVTELISREVTGGLSNLDVYADFEEKTKQTKRTLLKVLVEIKDTGHSIAGYGAPAKGNTLLNYCGIGRDFLDYTVDRSPHKQGKFLPGTHVPIFSPEKLHETKPDYVLILPWNLRDEITSQADFIRDWGGKFIVPIPEVEVLD